MKRAKDIIVLFILSIYLTSCMSCSEEIECIKKDDKTVKIDTFEYVALSKIDSKYKLLVYPYYEKEIFVNESEIKFLNAKNCWLKSFFYLRP